MANPTQKVAAGKLEAENFAVFLQGAKMDISSWRNWVTTCGDRAADQVARENQWRKRRHDGCAAYVRQLFDADSPNCCFLIRTMCAKTIDNVKLVNDCVAMLKRTHRIPASTSDIVTVTLLNWASPGSLHENTKRVQAEVLGTFVNSSYTFMHSLGLVVMPVTSTQHSGAGQVWRLQMKTHEATFFLNCRIIKRGVREILSHFLCCWRELDQNYQN